MKIVTIARMRFPADRMDDVRAAVARIREATLPEEGCIQYAFAEDLFEPGLVRISEVWASRAALDAHIAMPHVAEWRATVPTLGMSERDVRFFTVAGEETL